MLGIILIVICAALWATDALFRMPLARTMDPGTIVFLEHAIGVVATLPLFLTRTHELKALKTRGWLAIAFIGIMGSALGTFFFTASFRFVNPSVTILLQKLQPIFAVLGARVLLGEKPRSDFYPWGLVALVAAAMISLPERALSITPGASGNMAGAGLALLAAGCWGLSTVCGKFVTGRVSFPVTAFLRLAFGLLGITLLLALSFMSASRPDHLDAPELRSILYMALVPGVLALYLYYAGLKRTRASSATFAELFFPAAAVLINWRFLGQALTPTQMIGMGLLLTSVFFISKGMR